MEKGIAMMKELEGGFLGTITPDDRTNWHTSPPGEALAYDRGLDCMFLWGCCSPEGMRTLHTVWSKVVTETDSGTFINMPDRKFRHGPPKERGLEKAGAR